MTDETIGLPVLPAKWGRLRALAARLWRPRELRPVTAWIVVAVLAAVVGRHFWRDEGEFANILFAAAVTAALIAVVTLVARRALFATVVVASLVAVIVWAASAKRAMINMVVHAYDLFFYLSSWSTVSYMWSDQRRYVVGLIAACLALVLAGWVAYRLDSTRIARRRAVLLLAVFVALAWYGAYSKGERRHMQFYYSNLYVSSFYASWGETIEALWRGALLEAAPRAAATSTFTIPSRCDVAARPPHIILIHQELVVQPSLFPALRYDQSVDPFFKSDDRSPAQAAGGNLWRGVVADRVLAARGRFDPFVRRHAPVRPDLHPEQAEGYAAAGVEPVRLSQCRVLSAAQELRLQRPLLQLDRADGDLRPEGTGRQDRAGARPVLFRQRHGRDGSPLRGVPQRPLFTYIQTMSAHWPYDFKYEPEVDVPGGGPGTEPEMHEYLRRVSMAKMDYDYLLAELRSRFPDERFLVVHYGDHHPMATRTLLGYKDETEAEDVILDRDSIGFITYYAAKGVNYRVPALPHYETLDVSYLGTVMLDLAGLPLSDSHRERKRLMSLCRGRYYDCSSRDEILQFHRRLINSGVMAAR